MRQPACACILSVKHIRGLRMQSHKQGFRWSRPFVVMLGDLMDITERLFHLQTTHGWLRAYPRPSTIAVMPVPHDEVICLCCSARRRKRRPLHHWNLRWKPAPEDAPNDTIGHYTPRESSNPRKPIRCGKWNSFDSAIDTSIKHNVYLLVSSKRLVTCRRQFGFMKTSIDYALQAPWELTKTTSSNSERVSWGE